MVRHWPLDLLLRLGPLRSLEQLDFQELPG